MTEVNRITELWPVERFKPYAGNPRKNDHAVDKMARSIEQFGFKVPMLARSDGEIVDGHLRLKGAIKAGLKELPTILCDEWTPAQVKAFRIQVNRSAEWADWDVDLLNVELGELKGLDFDLSLTGFDTAEIDGLLLSATVPTFEPATAEEQGQLDRKKPVKCPECGHEFIAT